MLQKRAKNEGPMFLIRPHSGPVGTVGAAAVASGRAVTSIPAGVFPFSPYTAGRIARHAADPYGYQIGNQYTLRRGAPGDRTDCGTDATRPNLSDNGI